MLNYEKEHRPDADLYIRLHDKLNEGESTTELTKAQESEIIRVHDAYFDHYLKGNVRAMEDLLAEDYTQVGSAEDEDFFTKQEAVQFLHDTINRVAGKLDMRSRQTKVEQLVGLALVHERCDIFAWDGETWIFYARFRSSTLLKKTKDGWKFIHQHSSFPDSRAEEGENVGIEKVARENIELREAIKRRTIELDYKNRELSATIAELQETQAQLIHSEKMAAICQLVTGLAHEINNATNIVLNAVQMLRRRFRQEPPKDWRPNDEASSLLKMAEDGGLRISRIVNDLMTFARPAAVDKCQLLLLNQGLQSTIGLLEYHFAAEGMELLVELDPCQPYLRGNGNELNQVWLNLILNAIQAVDGAGTVRVTTSHDVERIYVTVADSGPGIDSASRAHIFNPFFTTKRPGKGTGLGLTVSYRIIANHGGTIELLDSPAGGAVFRVSLPRAGEPPVPDKT